MNSLLFIHNRLPVVRSSARDAMGIKSQSQVAQMNLSRYSLCPHKTEAAGLPFPVDNQTAEFSLHP
ncbi:hypothetical protein [Candidatus Electronema sp. TJ]|uniref:hypothetical protein n=1 Tax=Candidatus Electronema sp. TJ TaxID=3401573 RepID=UPI003AA86518